MTYKEFKRNVFVIFSETYQGQDISPIEYGIQRSLFEETKLQRLIALAEVADLATAKRKVAGWRRQLERVRQIRKRLEQRRSAPPISASVINPVQRPAPLAGFNRRETQPVRLQ